MIDYKALLLKYIAHVGNEEGTTFINCLVGAPDVYDQFSAEEIAVLAQMDEESML